MDEIRIELGDDREPGKCGCCGKPVPVVDGAVLDGGRGCGRYFASWSEGHPDRGIEMAVSIEDRAALGLSCRVAGDQIFFTILEPRESVWGASDSVGRMLLKREALALPALGDFFRVAEHVVQFDPRLQAFLRKSG
jgi:hypothetical protein